VADFKKQSEFVVEEEEAVNVERGNIDRWGCIGRRQFAYKFQLLIICLYVAQIRTEKWEGCEYIN